MSFNMSVIPPEARSAKHIAEHIEIYKKSMDTVRVHNPTDEDFVVYNDRLYSNERWTIPSKKKDLGKGKGNQDVPRYIAERYLNKMGSKLIQKKSREEWDKIKHNYRREEWGEYEGRMALKVTDASAWEDITPTLWIGVVDRYQMNEPDMPDQEPTAQSYSRGTSTLERLGIADRDVDMVDIQDAKTDLINKVS